MKKMLVTEYIIGKIVAEDIYDRQGKLLMKAGNKVSMSVVERLLKFNIISIWVK